MMTKWEVCQGPGVPGYAYVIFHVSRDRVIGS